MQQNSVIPVHLGIILDGNRRWAQAKGISTLKGHQRGSENLKTIAIEAFERGVQYFSAFVFSTENWSRTEKEVNYLMNLVSRFVDDYLEELHERGIKIVILGRRDGLRRKVVESLKKSEALTHDNKRGTLALCFNYGGKEELVDACRSMLNADLDPDKVSSDVLSRHLYQPDIPDVDLLIRTSGEKRLSGFMLFRSAYAELDFVDKHWPEFTKTDLKKSLNGFAMRKRRFGA
jgi:undecaprenyl diphosphate synthase